MFRDKLDMYGEKQSPVEKIKLIGTYFMTFDKYIEIILLTFF